MAVAITATRRTRDRREVGEALAGARRRLDDEVMRLTERRGDRLGEVALAGLVVAVEGPHAAIQHREPGLARPSAEPNG